MATYYLYKIVFKKRAYARSALSIDDCTKVLNEVFGRDRWRPMTECYIAMSTKKGDSVKHTIKNALPPNADLEDFGAVTRLGVFDFTSFGAPGDWEIVQRWVRNIYDAGDTVFDFPCP